VLRSVSFATWIVACCVSCRRLLCRDVCGVRPRDRCIVSKGNAKSQRRATGEFDALNDDELERALVERFNALGLTPDLPKTKTQH